MNNIEKIIEEYRQREIAGRIIKLSPVTEDDLPSIVRMRNEPKMMYYFNQKMELTLDDQKEWYNKYLQRTDDLYWVIKDNSGTVIGTNRIYDILPYRCEQGSLMIDSAYSRTAPFAVEAIMLSLDFAFDILGVQTIINDNRCDNKNMNSLSRRFGFRFLHETDIRGVAYNYYELHRESYKRDAIMEVLELWLSR